ncbi:DUF2776 family protein [Streptomyces sp. NBC_00272]|uniref:DUF2776 family protein n=1 Tax=Streptomyces sp. NBC_00272 TaxID=2975698 RepID=UPI003FA74C1A
MGFWAAAGAPAYRASLFVGTPSAGLNERYMDDHVALALGLISSCVAMAAMASTRFSLIPENSQSAEGQHQDPRRPCGQSPSPVAAQYGGRSLVPDRCLGVLPRRVFYRGRFGDCLNPRHDQGRPRGPVRQPFPDRARSLGDLPRGGNGRDGRHEATG